MFEQRSRKAPPGHKYFRVFIGAKTNFEEGNETNALRSITDGLSTALMIVEPANAVRWMKADKLVFDPAGPLTELGDSARINVDFRGFCRQLPPHDPSFDHDTFRALITATVAAAVILLTFYFFARVRNFRRLSPPASRLKRLARW
jgi:hypothetical protein